MGRKNGKNCREKTSAFVSTTFDHSVADGIATDYLQRFPKKKGIYVYRIRADHRFYSGYDSLKAAAYKYLQEGDKTKAEEYENLAYDFKKEEEWMAYKEIPTSLIQQPTYYPRNPGSLKDVFPNPSYVKAITFASQDPFPDSDKGCPRGFWQILKV